MRRSLAGSRAAIGRPGTLSPQILALALLVAVIYLPALEAGFVWDDVIFVEEAAARFEQAIESDPNHAEALDHLAQWRFQHRRYKDALDLYRAHSLLEPDSATIHANIGVTLYFLGRPEEALAAMQRVLQLDADHPMAGKLVEELRGDVSQPVR